MIDGSVIIDVALDTTKFTESMKMMETRITALASSFSSRLIGAFSGNSMATLTEGAFTALKANATSASNDIHKTLSDCANESIISFVSAPWAEAGTKASSSLSLGMQTGIPSILQTVASVMSRVNTSFNSTWESIGRNIALGIALGLRSSSDVVESAAEEIAKNTSNTLKGYYRISSPSALMRDEIGVMISRGIADGITSGASFIGNALSSVYGESERIRGFSKNDSHDSRTLTQNIYLRDNDPSPYRTARRIQREGEAIFGL